MFNAWQPDQLAEVAEYRLLRRPAVSTKAGELDHFKVVCWAVQRLRLIQSSICPLRKFKWVRMSGFRAG